MEGYIVAGRGAALWTLALISLTFTCGGSHTNDYAAAATGLGVQVAAVGIYRAVTGACWSVCGHGWYCDEGSGVCRRGECLPACTAGYQCVRETGGRMRCVGATGSFAIGNGHDDDAGLPSRQQSALAAATTGSARAETAEEGETASAAAESQGPDLGALHDRTSEFAAAWPAIHAALRQGRGSGLIEPSLGLVVLDNPGAFIVVTRVAVFPQAGRRSSDADMGACLLREAPLPEFDCSSESWTEEGCVLTRPHRPRVADLYDAYVRYALPPEATPSPAEAVAIRRVESLISVTVTDTARPTRWHFGFVRGRWRLLVMDLVTPCSA